MKKIKNTKLIKILLLLLIILVFFIIIKELKIIGFCCTLLNLISPVFFGFVIAWLIKPIMKYFNKTYSTLISTAITYIILSTIIFLLGYFLIPIVIEEIKNLIPSIITLYKNPKIINNLNFKEIGQFINNCTNNLKNVILNIFYSIFISYYFVTDHKYVSKFISKYIPSKLIMEISGNLKAFVKGTIIDTIILFGMTILSFWLFKMPYTLLFSIIISLTNVIPFIGPYIGGIPAVLVAFSISSKLGITILIIVVILQFIESSFIHPIIMSKALEINPIVLMIGLIVFGYFFGILGMLFSSPILSIIKTLYLYNKEHPFKLILGK